MISESQHYNIDKNWHFIIYYLSKISSTKQNYKIYNIKLLAIIKSFKTWDYYLEKLLQSWS